MAPLASQIARLAHLIGDSSRASILSALMHGRALHAFELASETHVTPQTVSFHLAKLLDGKLITAEKQGRHRFYRLATPMVGQMIQAISRVAAFHPPKDVEPHARICYDHIAGNLGVAITAALIDRAYIVLDEDAGVVTEDGHLFFHAHGIMVSRTEAAQSVFCRVCLDWTGQGPHLGGRVGTALCSHFFAKGWIRRAHEIRSVEITQAGKTALSDLFGFSIEDL
jgi:DNA-binding transcriptional ArsR family regulator